MSPESAHPFVVGRQYRNGHGAYEVLAVDYPSLRVRYENGRFDTLHIPLQQRIHERLSQRQAASDASPPSTWHRGASWSDDFDCLCCRLRAPKTGPRVCPACDHTFQWNAWEGIDAHWRSKHEHLRSYEAFWRTLCKEHRADR